MEHLCTVSIQFNPVNKFKLPLLSHLHISHFHTVNGSFSLNSMCSSPNLPFNKPKISQRKRHCVQDFPQLRSKFSVPALPKNSDGASPTSDNTKVVILSSVVTVVLAVANRVLYKLALVPMKEYPFFLAQLNTFGYVTIYFSILYTRYKAGIVTDEMIGLPKSRFMIIGLLEALGIVSGMSAGAMLPGPAIPVLNQTFLVWQLSFSSLLLGRKYSLNKLMGCLLVAAGVILAVLRFNNLFLHNFKNRLRLHIQICVSGLYKSSKEEIDIISCRIFAPFIIMHASGSDNGQMLSGTGLIWPLLMIASCAFQAGASILKESVFLDAVSRLKGRSLDIFVVNSFGSAFQALFVLLFLPVLSNLKGIAFSQLPSYFKSGASCFLNSGFDVTGCDGAPLLPLLYIFFNLCFNISLLHLVKISSAVVSSLAATSSVPISIYILSLPLPYLPEGVCLSPFFHLGGIVLLIGLFLYNMPQTPKVKSDVE